MVDLGDVRDVHPPGTKFFHFDAVFGENWPNNSLTPPLGLVLPLGNPGSTTDFLSNLVIHSEKSGFFCQKMNNI